MFLASKIFEVIRKGKDYVLTSNMLSCEFFMTRVTAGQLVLVAVMLVGCQLTVSKLVKYMF